MIDQNAGDEVLIFNVDKTTKIQSSVQKLKVVINKNWNFKLKKYKMEKLNYYGV